MNSLVSSTLQYWWHHGIYDIIQFLATNILFPKAMFCFVWLLSLILIPIFLKDFSLVLVMLNNLYHTCFCVILPIIQSVCVIYLVLSTSVICVSFGWRGFSFLFYCEQVYCNMTLSVFLKKFQNTFVDLFFRIHSLQQVNICLVVFIVKYKTLDHGLLHPTNGHILKSNRSFPLLFSMVLWLHKKLL